MLRGTIKIVRYKLPFSTIQLRGLTDDFLRRRFTLTSVDLFYHERRPFSSRWQTFFIVIQNGLDKMFALKNAEGVRGKMRRQIKRKRGALRRMLPALWVYGNKK